MMCYINLYNAKRRLVSMEQTVEMMGGEDECQPMILGQRDYLILEVEYFTEKCKHFTMLLASVAIMYGAYRVIDVVFK